MLTPLARRDRLRPALRCGGVLLLLTLACTPDRVVSWCGDDVVRARIVEGSLTRFALLGGSIKGGGLLIADRAGGSTCELPVELVGGQLGVSVEVTQAMVEMELEVPAGGVAGAHLFGRYDGSTAVGSAILGVSTLHLENGHGVGMDQANLTLGVGMGWTYAWLDVTEWVGVDLGDTAETGDTSGGPPDSGDSAAAGDSGTSP